MKDKINSLGNLTKYKGTKIKLDKIPPPLSSATQAHAPAWTVPFTQVRKEWST